MEIGEGKRKDWGYIIDDWRFIFYSPIYRMT
jgi:hypothetical protein